MTCATDQARSGSGETRFSARTGQPGREEGVTAPILLGACSTCGQRGLTPGTDAKQTTRFPATEPNASTSLTV
jgi:hypothetical protein